MQDGPLSTSPVGHHRATGTINVNISENVEPEPFRRTYIFDNMTVITNEEKSAAFFHIKLHANQS